MYADGELAIVELGIIVKKKKEEKKTYLMLKSFANIEKITRTHAHHREDGYLKEEKKVKNRHDTAACTWASVRR